MLAALKGYRPKVWVLFRWFERNVRPSGRDSTDGKYQISSPLTGAYSVSKVAGFDLTRNYPEAYGIYASSGILFSHKSPRRGFEFVTRKITSGNVRILAGQSKVLPLGNLDGAKRDWGHARDYVEAMWLMLQHGEPDDYVVATGKSHSVSEFAQMAFGLAGLDPKKYITANPDLYRPAEVHVLPGNSAKAHAKLGWRAKTDLQALVREMAASDFASLGVDIPVAQVTKAQETRMRDSHAVAKPVNCED